MEEMLNLSTERLLSTRQRILLRHVAALAAELGLPIHLVGGFARDALLGRPVTDFDLVLDGNAVRLGRALVKDLGGRLTVHAKFHTARWELPPRPGVREAESLDLISARSERYEHPAALPTVKLGTLEEDLRRRDFTINAMAVRLEADGLGGLTDPLDGRSDLQRGLIRVLHPRSFLDDPTRLFRAVRYAGRYGFQIEPASAALIPAACPFVQELSAERLRHELDLIFAEAEPVPMIAALFEQGILQHVRPALPWDAAVRARLEKAGEQPESRWILWLAGLTEAEIRALAKRLHFNAERTGAILAAASICRELEDFKELSPSQCVKRLEGSPEAAILAAAICAPPGKPREMLERYLTKWKDMKPLTTSERLKSLGVKPGPRFGEILWRLRSAWLDGEVQNEEEEQFLLATLLHG